MNRLLLLRATATGANPTSGATFFGLDMSIFRRFINHGRELVRYHLQVYCHPGKSGKLSGNIGPLDPLVVKTSGRPKSLPRVNPQNTTDSVARPFIQWIGQEVHAQVRQIFLNNVLNRVTNSLSADLRRKATQQLLHGNNSRPFFALVGVSLASGTGMLTKGNEFEGICWEIRDSLEKKQTRLVDRGENCSPFEIAPVKEEELSVKNLEFGPLIAKGCSAAVYSARWKPQNEESREETDRRLFPLGVKMMFNFYCESNSASIIRAMCKEIVPAKRVPQLEGISKEDLANIHLCPPHPNIIEISHVFTDQMPCLKDAMEFYPDALPRRLNEDGLGRNMSLFLVMKRYSCTLNSYLKSDRNLKLKNRLLIFTQLLEGCGHLRRHEIAHRDLKSDNILLDLDISGDPEYPLLKIADFGSSFASKGLLLPFPTMETDRGGNACSMAPEVITATPGVWKKICYGKADAWSCGLIGFEIFGAKNPFTTRLLDSRNYQDSQIPNIPNIPKIINSLIHGLLKRATAERLSVEVAATICHIALFAPTQWLKFETKGSISDSEIMQWLLTLTTKLLCQQPLEAMKLEFILIQTFLQRVQFSTVRDALDWIHMINTTYSAKN